MDVFSPFIPLNARESATPGTIIKYKIKNTSAQATGSNTNWMAAKYGCLELEKKDKLEN